MNRKEQRPIIRTVTGDISPEDVSTILFHEHLVIDVLHILDDYDLKLNDPETVISELKYARKESELDLVVDCSTIDLGRDIRMLRQISEHSGTKVVAGTGFYLDVTFPQWIDVHDEFSLADRFVKDITQGAESTDIRCGIIGEIGVSREAITLREKTVIRAAAIAHQRTGAPIVTHTGDGAFAREQLELFLLAGAKPEALAIGHLDALADVTVHAAIADAGAFIGFDRVGIVPPNGAATDSERVERIVALLEQGYEDQLLLSSDIARLSRFKAHGGDGYAVVLVKFLSMLSGAGVDANTLKKLVRDNPRRLLSWVPTSQ